MDKNEFWKSIEDGKAESVNKDTESFFTRMVERLTQYSFEDIMDWHLIYHEYKDAAYGSDMCAASMALGPDYADEGLIDFRAWLITCGKEVYMNALRDPDTLADAPEKDKHFNYGKFDHTAYYAYNAKLFLVDPDSPQDLISALEFYELNAGTVQDIHAELPERRAIGWNWTKSTLPALFPKICAKHTVKEPDSIQTLMDSRNVVHAYVYESGGRREHLFHGTPENIASFLGGRPHVEWMILTDPMDLLIMDTIGNFIDHCPDKVLLEEVKKTLIPIQLGEAEPESFFCPTLEEVEAFYEEQEDFGMQMR